MTPQERAALVDQLRHRPVGTIAAQMREAADEIETLAQQVATLRAALEPFAKMASALNPPGTPSTIYDGDVLPAGIRAGDLRRARAALAQTEPKVTT